MPALPKLQKSKNQDLQSKPNLEKLKKTEKPDKSRTVNDTNELKSKNKHSTMSHAFHNIPRNVNLYRHLITEAATTETDIEWILGLRFNSNSNKPYKRLAPDPFHVYGRTIEGRKLKQTFTDLDAKGDIAKFSHLVFKRFGPTASKSLVAFETNLRNYTKDNELKKKELSFRPYAYKEKNEFPKFLPTLKEEIEMRSKSKLGEFSLESKQVSAFEGRLHYPKYDIRFSKKNINDYLHLAGKDTERGTIEWELSLR